MKKTIWLTKYYLTRIFLYLFVLPKNGVGVEVGVWRGTNAKLLYYLTRPKRLDLFDSYAEDHRTKEERETAFRKVYEWTVYKRAYLYRITSSKGSNRFNYKSIDWIYIDGDHWDLYNDLNIWYLKVKKGGIVMGDDYSETFPEVKRDLNKFCNERGIEFKTKNCQWWFRK